MMEVTFLSNLSRKLASTNITLSQILPQILGPQHQSQVDRPFPQFNGVTIIAPPMGVSNYYATLVRFKKRYSRGLNINATYTWARFFTNTNNPGTALGDDAGPYSNFYNRGADYGSADNDIRHRVSFSAVYELPFGAGRQFLSSSMLGKIVGGWSISNITGIQTGAPMTVTTQTNTTNAFSAGALRPNVIRNPNLPKDQRTVSQWFDTGAYVQPPQFQFGNEGVGTLRAAGLINLDFSLQREFKFTEHLRLHLRGEFVNALNHTNFGLPGHTLNGAGFGVINSVTVASGPRTIQVGARIAF
jgi:hypothetical protein